MQNAIDYEIRWQIEQIEDGYADPASHRAVRPRHGRDPRHAHQGRRGRLPRLPRPRPATAGRDLASLDQDVKGSQMAELPRTMAARFVGDYGLPEYDADHLDP